MRRMKARNEWNECGENNENANNTNRRRQRGKNNNNKKKQKKKKKKVSHRIKSQTVMTSITYIVNYCANKQTQNKSLFVIIFV